MIKRLLMVGGGTVGHTAPLVAVGEVVRQLAPDIELTFVGTRADVVSSTISNAGFFTRTTAITAGKLNRFITWRHLPELCKFGIGLIQAVWVMARYKPELIFSKAGAVSVPIAYAARLFRVPVMSHETDVAPGLTNRIIAQQAVRIFTAFPAEAYPTLPESVTKSVGQPVRPLFFMSQILPVELDGRAFTTQGLPLILATGGSQGGEGVNRISRALIDAGIQCCLVLHCGATLLDSYRSWWKSLPPAVQSRVYLSAFIEAHQFAGLMQQADLVLTRSGGTIFELAATRAASVLIPLPTAAQNHQRKNAEVLVRAQAAIVIDQTEGNEAQAVQEIHMLLNDLARCQDLRKNIAQFSHPEAARRIAEDLVAYSV